ncbi:MAG: single-stranded DNA-binding protein [Clostridia bacterium]|nr:single-stranded DNA-binding protein [Clostridia bacterium]
MNKIYLIGNVVHTPEKRVTNSGIPVCNFSLAVRRRFKSANGETETDFFDVQAWRQHADLCEKYLEKGRKVAVTGSMQSREYIGKDGSKRRVWEVMADEVEFLTPKSEGTEAPKQISKSNTNGFDPAEEGFAETTDDELPF